jgi:hypothetical protein
LPAGQIRSEAAEAIGTFRRAIAQQRLDREFFQIGNPLFDAITDAALHDPFGRTYAVQCKSPATPAWSGFEFVFSAQPNLAALGDRRDLAQLLKSHFFLPPQHVFVRLDGSIEQDAQRLRVLRQSLVKQNKDRAWISLWHDRQSTLDAVFPAHEWPHRVQELSSIAEDNARTLLAERLNTVLAEPRTRWESLSRQGREKGSRAALQEAKTLDLLLAAMSDWDVYQEGAGFLSVNQSYEGAW